MPRSYGCMLSQPFPSTKPWTTPWSRPKLGLSIRARKTASAKKERDEAKKKAQHTQLVVVAVGDTKALAKDKLARVQDALVVTKEAKPKAEVEAARLEVERTSLMGRLGLLRMKCLFSTLRRARIRSPWRRIARRPWS